MIANHQRIDCAHAKMALVAGLSRGVKFKLCFKYKHYYLAIGQDSQHSVANVRGHAELFHGP